MNEATDLIDQSNKIFKAIQEIKHEGTEIFNADFDLNIELSKLENETENQLDEQLQSLFASFSILFDLINDIKANSDKFRKTIETVIKNAERKKIDNGGKLEGGALKKLDNNVKQKLDKEDVKETGLSKSILEAKLEISSEIGFEKIEEKLRERIKVDIEKYNDKLMQLRDKYR